jgi:hypothetical protein
MSRPSDIIKIHKSLDIVILNQRFIQEKKMKDKVIAIGILPSELLSNEKALNGRNR